ncbi:MAG: hypothetical protein ACKOHG_15850 [Planctomycetia bacterium]
MEIEIPDVALGQPAAAEMLAVWLVAGCCFAVSMAVAWIALRRCRQGLPVVERRPHGVVPWGGADVAAAALAFLGLQVLAAEMLPAEASLHVRLAAGSIAMLTATAVSAVYLSART